MMCFTQWGLRVGVENSRNVIIRRSDDGGISWTFPRDSLSEGVIKCGKFSTAPVPVVIYNGRIWRAMETGVKGEVPRAFVMSAPIDSNLMKLLKVGSLQTGLRLIPSGLIKNLL